jgi:hypothetical protein
VIPGARADKHAVDKVVRAIVAVGRATIRVIPVIAVAANRSRTVIGRAHSNADNHSLCVGRNCQCKHANRQQSNIF